MTMSPMAHLIVVAVFVALPLLSITVPVNATNREVSPARQPPKPSGGFKSPCGTAKAVTEKIANCLNPTFEILDGRVPPPVDDRGLVNNCNKFNESERCARNVARDCLSGIHKSALGAIVSSSKQFRVRECKTAASRARYLSAYRCLSQSPDMLNLLRNHTGMTQCIRDLPLPSEQRLLIGCCMLESLDRSIAATFNKRCPENVPLMLDLFHSVTEDAQNILCVKPKCQGVLEKLPRHQYKPPQAIIEPVMEIVLAL